MGSRNPSAIGSDVIPHGLTTTQFQAVTMMALGWSQVDTAKRLGICPNTLTNWKKNDGFALALQEHVGELAKEAGSRAHGLVSRAMDGLSELVHSEEADIKLKACLGVMRHLGPAIRERSHDAFADWSEDRLAAELERVQAAIMQSDARRVADAEWRELKDSEGSPTTNPLKDPIITTDYQESRGQGGEGEGEGLSE